jgi:hypothetical protein
LAGREGDLPMMIRGGGDSLFTMGFQAAIKDGPAAPELAPMRMIASSSSKDRPNTRLRRDQRLIAGSPPILSPVPMLLYT